MKAQEKLKQWRETDMGLSTRELAQVLHEKMKPDFPNGFQRGEEIFQSDIVLAEKGTSRKRFEKVAAALYQYMGIEKGYFGTFVKVKPEEILSAAVEGKEEFRNKIIELQTKLIEAHETISALNQEKVGLLKQVFEFQKEVEELRRKVAEMGRGK
ncbi:MAG: hypothetical protein ACKVU2_06655 [Saprospiraceae bacterium]